MKKTKTQSDFLQGVKDGIPIGLGYLSVSFGFGITAVSKGISVLAALIISMTNLTSAGQVAGIGIIAAGGTLVEMAVAQLFINLRYSLMSISLSQKLDGSFNTANRLITSFGITDEIFAVASGKTHEISAKYMYGLIIIPFIGWSAGTFLGASAGEILPTAVKAALGMAIYGMFIAIVVPPAKKYFGVLIVVIISAAISCCFKYIPVFSEIPSGFALIICAIAASLAGAVFFPTSKLKKEDTAR